MVYIQVTQKETKLLALTPSMGGLGIIRRSCWNRTCELLKM